MEIEKMLKIIIVALACPICIPMILKAERTQNDELSK